MGAAPPVPPAGFPAPQTATAGATLPGSHLETSAETDEEPPQQDHRFSAVKPSSAPERASGRPSKDVVATRAAAVRAAPLRPMREADHWVG
eukprot:1535955-Prymnesium_polylepis.1